MACKDTTALGDLECGPDPASVGEQITASITWKNHNSSEETLTWSAGQPAPFEGGPESKSETLPGGGQGTSEYTVSFSAVPVARTREWVARMRELGMEHVYVEVKGGDHSAFINADRAMVSKLFSFFDIAKKNERAATP